MVIKLLIENERGKISNSNNIAVIVRNVTKSYFKKDKKIYALKDINFEVQKGEIFSIVGKSGSGKTTLLSLIGAMKKPSNGKIIINNTDLSKLSEKKLAELRRNTVATVYQNYNLIPVLDALSNVELPMRLLGMNKKERIKRAKELLKKVELEDRMNHFPEEMSGGEKERVAIARALANEPEILLCDEPTGELDKETGQKIVELLENINKENNTTLIIVTHDLKLAERANRQIVLENGQIIKSINNHTKLSINNFGNGK